MAASSKWTRWSSLRRLAVLTGAAGITPAVATAQPMKYNFGSIEGVTPPVAAYQTGRFVVQAAPQVLYRGHTTRVAVFVCPSDPSAAKAPNAPYAFASAAFDVLANDPRWSFASAGVIDGSDVLGIEVGQNHEPQSGLFADPSNPILVWHGLFTPLSDAPALVEIEAVPTDFAVYPRRQSRSSVEVFAGNGNDVVLANPLSVGRWLAAPGRGTSLEIHDDVIIDGRILTGENWNTASVGVVPADDVALVDSSTRIEFDRQPVSFTATVQALGSVRNAGSLVVGADDVDLEPQRSMVRNLTVTFSGLESEGYSVGADFLFADGHVPFEGFLGGVRVAAGELNGNLQIAQLVVSALPQTIEGHVELTRQGLSTASNSRGSSSTGDYGLWRESYGVSLRYDQPVVANFRSPDGTPATVTLDWIELQSTQLGVNRPTSEPNPVHPTLGGHIFKAEGVGLMRIIPAQGE